MKSLVMTLALIMAAHSASADMFFGSKSYAAKKNEYCYTKLAVPQILTGPGTSASTQQAVDKLNAAWAKELADGKKDYEESIVAEKETCSDYNYAYETYSSFEFKTPLNATILSIVTTDWTYSGGAHGIGGYSSLTLNTQTGETYAGLDTFIDNSKLGDVKKLLHDKLIERDKDFDFDMGYNAWDKDTDNISKIDNYYLTEQGIVIYYNAYQIASYADGTVELTLYWYELQSGILKTTGPATQLLTGIDN